MNIKKKQNITQDEVSPRTSSFFHGYAEDFTNIYGNEQTPINRFINRRFRKSMRYRYEMTIDSCQPIQGRTVLDIGCGPGHYSRALAKQGAARVLGVDFADGMLEIARRSATEAAVGDICEFVRADFATFSSSEKFDYSIVMGFMDYMEDPQTVIDKVLSLTRRKAIFSFPVRHGILAWQRRQRYRLKCDLYMYANDDLKNLFKNAPCNKFVIKEIARDYFVVAELGS